MAYITFEQFTDIFISKISLHILLRLPDDLVDDLLSLDAGHLSLNASLLSIESGHPSLEAGLAHNDLLQLSEKFTQYLAKYK